MKKRLRRRPVGDALPMRRLHRRKLFADEEAIETQKEHRSLGLKLLCRKLFADEEAIETIESVAFEPDGSRAGSCSLMKKRLRLESAEYVSIAVTLPEAVR